MRNVLLLLLVAVILSSCEKDKENFEGKLELSSNEIKETIDVEIHETHLGYCMVIDGFNYFDLKLENIEPGTHYFGRGEKNDMLWLFHHYSNWKMERSGYLEISSNNNNTVSGDFEVICESDIDGVLDTVIGKFTEIDIVNVIKPIVGQGCGSINDVLKSSSEVEYRLFGNTHSWILNRPHGENLILYVNGDSLRLGVYDLNSTETSARTLNPHVEYGLNNKVYSSFFGKGSLNIKSHNTDRNELHCVLNGTFENTNSTDSLEIGEYEMFLYYE